MNWGWVGGEDAIKLALVRMLSWDWARQLCAICPINRIFGPNCITLTSSKQEGYSLKKGVMIFLTFSIFPTFYIKSKDTFIRHMINRLKRGFQTQQQLSFNINWYGFHHFLWYHSLSLDYETTMLISWTTITFIYDNLIR